MGAGSLWPSSSGVQHATLQKDFSHLSLVIYFFPTPTLEIKLGLQIGRRLLISNSLGPISHHDCQIRNREQQLDHVYYTLLWQLLGFAMMPFTSLSKLCKNAGPKIFCLSKLARFDFCPSSFNFQDHILSTTGAALTGRLDTSYILSAAGRAFMPER